MFKLSRKRLFALRAWIKDDSGVAALIIAAAIVVIAFTALSIFFSKLMGNRELARVQSGASGQSRVVGALYAYYLSGTTHKLPCPDTATTPTGAGISSCATASTNYVGVVPWKDLGLSRSDVIDSYGNFYTYIVSGDANGMCESITKNFVASGGSSQEFTGQVITSTLEALLTSETNGTGRKVPFAIISHGANGTGALSSGGAYTSTPSKAGEQANAANASNPSRIFTGPTDVDSSSSTYFDDQVLVPSTTDVQKICGQLTPGGSINASVADSFNSAAATASNFSNVDSAGAGTNGVTIQASTADARNKVASFAVTTAGGGAATSYLVTNSDNFNFDPVTRAVYAKATWRAGANSATFSVATRASEADLTAGSDLFDAGSSNGITFRFGPNLEIRNGSAVQLASGAGITITSGTLYTLEVYDNGSDVWMRIYPAATPSSAATLTATNVTADTGGDQQVLFINPSTTATAEIDDVTVGFPMLAAETSGAITSYITSTGNGTSTGRLTLEAWVRPRALPSSGNNAALISKWDTNAESTSSFRLRMDSTGQVYLDLVSTGTSTVVRRVAGPVLTSNTWSHIAVSYTFTGGSTNTETVKFFQDGDPYSSATTSVAGATGINYTSVPDFYVGADLNNATVADPFNGDLADVRVWKEARTPEQIRSYFQTRLSANSIDTSIDDLVVNWRLDSESLNAATGLTFTAAAASGKGTAGTVHSASLVPALALYFRPLATSFCPGAVSGAYQCDFRVATTSGAAGSASSSLSVPNNLMSFYAKVWGAGGGGYKSGSNQNAGGGGGYSTGKVFSINTVPIYQLNSGGGGTLRLKVYVGGYGTGSTTTKSGGGGGAGSGIFDSSGNIAIVAGGGGGASFSNDDPSTGGKCADYNGTTSQCGLGGNGDGLTATASATDAPDAVSQCGGRGGDDASVGSGPPTSGGGTGDCDDGGAPNTLGNGGAAGTTGGAAGSDGSANLMAGGRGANADETDNVNSKNTNANAIGAGGGGGGAVGGEAGGYNHAKASIGYGGGGGSAATDTHSGVTNTTGAAGSYALSTDSVTGNYTSVNNGLTAITGISKDIIAAGWTVGMTINGTGLKKNTTIASIDGNFSMTAAKGSGHSAHTGATITATGISGDLSSVAGGNTDFYYFPSYISSSTYSRPGVGGYSSTSISGSAGAVVLIW